MLFFVNGFTDNSDNLIVYRKSNCFYSRVLLEHLNFLQSNLYLQFISITDLFGAVLGLHCCMGFLSTCGQWGLLSSCLHGLLIAVASLGAQPQLLPPQGSRAQAQVLWSTGLVAPPHGGSFQIRRTSLCLLQWQVDSLSLSYQESPSIIFTLVLVEEVR